MTVVRREPPKQQSLYTNSPDVILARIRNVLKADYMPRCEYHEAVATGRHVCGSCDLYCSCEDSKLDAIARLVGMPSEETKAP